jgi:sporulation protein YlmC with PRC-barrel domain
MQLKIGVKVISNDGQKIGILDRVIMDSKNDSVTHLVISSGLLIKKRKLINSPSIKPCTWERSFYIKPPSK